MIIGVRLAEGAENLRWSYQYWPRLECPETFAEPSLRLSDGNELWFVRWLLGDVLVVEGDQQF
jgi:hypothetical protein